MKRKDFLRKIGLGAIGVAVAPMLILENKRKTSGERHLKKTGFYRKYPLTYRQCWSPGEILKIYKQTGGLIMCSV